jgi:hypothetical protein
MDQFGRASRWLTVGFLLGGSVPASTQPFEQLGVRPLGMAGAFVAVADDASAVVWNPAGLAHGPFFNLTIERVARQREPEESSRRAAIEQATSGFSAATLPLGLSYHRSRYTTAVAAPGEMDRETGESLQIRVSSLITHETGVTVLHSLTPGLVVGVTPKIVRGVAMAAGLEAPTLWAALDEASNLIGRGTTRFDADLGMHLVSGVFRAGLTVRHLTAPGFATVSGEELSLPRQIRAGVAWVLREVTTLAADVDLTRGTDDPEGRRLAIGVEQRWHPRVATRAGVNLGVDTPYEPWLALGGSVAVRPGLWVDGFWSRGELSESRWGVAGRVAY